LNINPGFKMRLSNFNLRRYNLVLFRGDVLHAVESNGWARSGGYAGEAADMDMEAVRLSFAFNEDSLANDRKLAAAAAGAGAGAGAS
jgi:hypothetical protein